MSAPTPDGRPMRRPARRSNVAAFAAILVGSLTTCGDPTGPSDLVGTYVLRTAAGKPLPYLVPGATNNFAIYGSQMTLTADGRFAGIDSAASLGDTRRGVQRYTGTWRFVRDGYKGQDVVYLRQNSLVNGLPLPEEFTHKVRDGGRTLVSDTGVSGQPIGPFVFTRE